MANEFSLILGCGGFIYNSITLCSATTSILINFDQHFEEQFLTKIMDFLDNAGLFDRPIIEWNKIVNTTRLLRNRFNLIPDNMWEALSNWFVTHKRCGAYLRLVFNNEIRENKEKEEFIGKQKQVIIIH